MSAIARLSKEDRLILWPDKVWPQNIGALAVIDGTSLLDSEGPFRIETAKQVIADLFGIVDLVALAGMFNSFP